MSRQGMAVGMVFVFIVAGLTFALIAVFGYGIITDFLEKGEQVEFIQFKTELESAVKKIYTEYGAIRTVTFHLPLKYERICFVDLDTQYDSSCTFDPYGCDVWKDAQGYEQADENVFLTPPAPAKIKVYKVDIDDGSFCLPVVDGSFTLRLEGRGDRTGLREGVNG